MAAPHFFPVRLLSLAALLAAPLVAGAAPAAAASEPVTYNQHIRPILADNCFSCHGSDAQHRKAKLRLDLFEGATRDHNGTRAIVPGDLANSDAWVRITSTDPDEIMPPSDSHKNPLKPAQIALIKRWIEQGAVYQKHWAFEPIARVAVPAPIGGAAATDNPIDRFIGARLAPLQLALAREASAETLLRRVTFDLTGLPPTLEELDAFAADRAPGAYERAVDRLLTSPRYGEHFGRHWLDAVRYGDTHGLHLDNVRNIWPYRDWVVRAFNRNQPFDQFTIDQLAGDLLPNPTIDQRVATGFNRCNLSTSEGGAIEPELEARNTADRVDTTAAVWLGLTTNCASCHDHKFDPISQRDFYAMGAFFKGLADRVWDGNVRLAGPVAVVAQTPEQQRRIDQIAQDIVPLEAAVTARSEQLIASQPKPKKYTKTPITYEVVWAEDTDMPTPENVMAPPAPGEWRSGPEVPTFGGKSALRLEGASVRPIAFTAGDVILTARTEVKAFAYVRPDSARLPRAISLEFISEEKTRRFIWGDINAFGAEVARTAIPAGPLPPADQYTRLELTACDSGVESGKTYTGLRLAQSDGAVWWDHIGAVITSPSASDDPLLAQGAWANSLRTGARAFAAVPIRHDINFLIGLSGTQQNEEEKARIAAWHRDYISAPLRAALEPEVYAARRLLAEQVHYETTLPVTPISAERAVPLPAHILIRGQYDKPGELVQPGLPAFLPPLAVTGPRPTRLDLARWLVDAKNPLTARVTVNRFWQQLFGAGLVRTPSDFGNQGEPPTHPELLDWLAVEFVRTGWDVKAFVRLLVTSRTYRQDSRVSPELLDRDPANKLLARGPRYRLDAEELRDQSLALGGLLVPTLGGPPVRPYQPINIWEPVAFGGSNTKDYVQEHGEALYRRSLYTFAKRTAPAPSMSTFDAPSRETFCVGRGRSNTPLQALALMNDVQQFEAARAFAERLLTRPGSERERLDYGFRSVTARVPTSEERTLLADALKTQLQHFAAVPEEAAKVIANGESKPRAKLAAPEFAAWTMVANLLLNLDETVTRN
jgi:mono/diheme cytochrome c family protein